MSFHFASYPGGCHGGCHPERPSGREAFGKARLRACPERSRRVPIGLPPPFVIPRDFSPEESAFQSFLRSLRLSCPVNSPHILEAVMEAVILRGLQAAKLSGRHGFSPADRRPSPLVIPRDFTPEESAFQSFSVASGYRVPSIRVISWRLSWRLSS